MTRTAISAIYTIFLIVITVGIPLLLYFGTNEPAGWFAAILSFGILLSYMIYANKLNDRN